MRFIRGRTLHEAAQHFHHQRAEGQVETMALRELMQAFLVVCNTVAYAHSRGVIHRDLKGRNVVLGDFGAVFVLDWGLAKVVPGPGSIATETWPTVPEVIEPSTKHSEGDIDLTVDGQVLGTPGFMAPEQAEARLDMIDKHTDIYGLGAVLYEVLTGRAPFHGGSTFDLLRRIVNEPVQPPRALVADTPPALQAICLKAMAKRPGERYGSVAELANDLRRWLADEPISVFPEPFLKRLGRWVRRHRTLVAAASVLLATAFVALAVSTVLIGLERNAKAKAYQLADSQRRIAVANLKTARAAVERNLTEIAGSDDLKGRGLEPLRARLLAGEREFYEQFAREHADDPARRYDLALATFHLGEIHNLSGDLSRAEELLKKAVVLLEPLAGEPGSPRTIRGTLADALNELASIQYSTGRLDDAETTWHRVLDLSTQLGREEPANDRHKIGAGEAQNNLGVLYNEKRLWDQSEAAICAALRLFEDVIRNQPGNAQMRHDIAACHSHLGTLALERRRLSEAGADLDLAIDAWKVLADEHPLAPEYRSNRALALNSRGALQRRSGQIEQGRADWNEARLALEVLAHDHPHVPEYRRWLTKVLLNLASFAASPAEAERFEEQAAVLLEHPETVADRDHRSALKVAIARRLYEMKQYQAALSHYDAAVKMLEPERSRASARASLCDAYQLRSQTKSALGLHREGLEDLDRAFALSDQNLVGAHVFRAVVLARAGDHAAAAAAADELAGRIPNTLPIRGNMACAYARAAAAALKDSNVPEAERRALAARYTDRALDQLQKLQDTGLLNTPAAAEEIAADPDLEPIRDHPRFHALLDAARRPQEPRGTEPNGKRP
jgi:tetratricopeptide (TPR) repeat protein